MKYGERLRRGEQENNDVLGPEAVEEAPDYMRHNLWGNMLRNQEPQKQKKHARETRMKQHRQKTSSVEKHIMSNT